MMIRGGLRRCDWVGAEELYVEYHDQEWGVPVYDDRMLFEMMILEGAQAGLSWITVLRKRETYRQAFDNFDPEAIAGYGPDKVATLMEDTGIVRNRAKIAATIGNAQAWLDIMAAETQADPLTEVTRAGGGAFSNFVWSFVGGAPIVNRWQSLAEVPAETAESQALSKALKKKGFRFVGPTICYAFMQATGMVNDHTMECFRYDQV
ncbi:DNA-3-methyladenine glycosylase I [Pelagibius sp. Alg239-R121]|uniref:DNA-3-methyladenine glycosylase I n=1 Tax=Pelagibius sp. Alg239-R121 TaxID=2993448 RepID=UPI0024A772C5|nr:DNA-3-methyladenine glycosylase I [Pelagibius sp. Alg239-R121]